MRFLIIALRSRVLHEYIVNKTSALIVFRRNYCGLIDEVFYHWFVIRNEISRNSLNRVLCFATPSWSFTFQKSLYFADEKNAKIDVKSAFFVLFIFKAWYQITNSPFVFPYVSYRSREEKLLKYQ